MTRECVVAAYLIVGCCALAAAEDPGSRTTNRPTQGGAIPLQTLTTVTAEMSGDGFLSWSGPPLCDQRKNVYLLLVPHGTARNDGTAGAGAALRPRDVLRISSDGKKRTTFNPAQVPKFSNADDLLTIGAALDQHGTLFTLVWARWREGSAQTTKSGQFILSFKADGQFRSQVEVDPDQILVDKFEVFGSGDFLLRGRRANSSDARLAILASSGQTLQDVRRWSGKFLDEPSPETPPHFDHMVRGRDGRIYITQPDPGEEGDTVYAISSNGDAERMFKLPRMPKDPSLLGWTASDDAFAATYHDGGERSGRWWVAVYRSEGEDVETTVYGPAPGPPICYEHVGAKDRFTFVKDGSKLVTMSSP